MNETDAQGEGGEPVDQVTPALLAARQVTRLAADLYAIGLTSVGPDDLDNRQLAEGLIARGWTDSAALRAAAGAPDVDDLAEVARQAIQREAAVWEVQFDAGPGLAVGVPDAALVAVRAVLDRLAITGAGDGAPGLSGHSCENCGGIAPGSCAFNPHREADDAAERAAAAPVPVAAGDEAVERAAEAARAEWFGLSHTTAYPWSEVSSGDQQAWRLLARAALRAGGTA